MNQQLRKTFRELPFVTDFNMVLSLAALVLTGPTPSAQPARITFGGGSGAFRFFWILHQG